MKCFLRILLSVLFTGCGGLKKGQDSAPSYTPSSYTTALNRAAKILIQRLPSTDEATTAATGPAGYEKVIRSYLETPAFEQAMTRYFREYFELGGMDGAINKDEPANLAVYLVVNNLDYRDVVKANYCVANDHKTKARCSTFASTVSQADVDSHSAGAMTTQAWLKSWTGNFNFSRVKRSFLNFSCSEYPDGDDPGMTVSEISATVKTFNRTTGDPVCYTCHRTLNPRAAQFYNFNGTDGSYSASTTGTTMAGAGIPSTLSDLLVPGAIPRYHDDEKGGAPAPMLTIRDYGQLISRSKGFQKCTAQVFSNFMLGKSASEAKHPISGDLAYLVDKVRDANFKAKELIIETAKSAAFIGAN